MGFSIILIFIAALVFLLILLGIIIAVVVVLRNRVRGISREFFGTDNFKEGLDKVSDEVATRPRSVSGMTKLMEPQIVRDFPEFVWDEFKTKAENLLKASLTAIATGSMSALPKDVTQDVRQQISNVIENNRASGITEHFDAIRIHQTEIANYRKGNGKCVITIQSALQCFHYKEKDGKIIRGDKERLTQTKYNLELVYIQDSQIAGFDNSVGVTCPNCGAPVRNLGAKFCEYCGSGVTPINIKVWSLHNFVEVDYNHV